MRLCCFSAYRFQILFRDSDAELLIFSHISSVRIKWVWASARFEAFGWEPVRRRLAKCDAGSSRTGGFFPPRRGLSVFRACVFCVARTSAQRGLLHRFRAHTRSLPEKPHTAATRASRRGAGARHTRRVDSDDFFHGGKIGTIDPFQADEALSVALSKRYENAVFP